MLEGSNCEHSAQAIWRTSTRLTATDDMERAWSTGDLLSNVESDLEFHALIVGRCRNRMLVDLYRSVRDHSPRRSASRSRSLLRRAWRNRLPSIAP